MNRSKSYFNNKFQDFIVFFKNLKGNPSGLIYLFMVLVVPVFLITFQNCKATDLDTSSIESGESSGTNYNRGHIIRIDPETDDFIEDGLLPINTDIKMKFINTHEDADTYKWTINRGFKSIVTEALTETETYQTQFSQVGAYDVLANSYESETFLRAAGKRFVAGQSCSLTDVLEIELSSGSLQVGQSATFELRHSDEFSSIEWKATLPSNKVVEEENEENTDDQEDSNTLELSFEDESAGDLIIEVSASHVDRSACLTYRKQNLNVTSTLRPHFNPITLTDGSDEIAVMLENNDIYKYLRPSGHQYLQIEILHADTCSYQVDQGDETDFTCSSGLIDISLDSDTNCHETVINLSASISDDGQEAETKTYYNYCPKDGDYCYLGTADERQNYHLCSLDIASKSDSDSNTDVARTSFEADLANGRCGEVNNDCQIGESQDLPDTDTHYKWQCLGVGGGNTTDCEKLIPIDGVCDNSQRDGCLAGESNDDAIADTDTYYKWSCEGLHDGSTANDCQIRKPIDGVCDNSQRDGCLAGDPDDAAIADTNTHYRWHCKGQYGGSTATSCQRELPPQPVNGVCDNSKKNGCSPGTPDANAIADTNTYYRWHCIGEHGGSTATNCQIRKPVNGICDNSKRNGCSPGTPDANAIADTNTHYKWHCIGEHDGSTATNCQIRKPVNGVCDNSKRNGCSPGTPDANAIADTNTHYKWHCIGEHGGTTATSCQIRKPINGACNNNQRNGCSAGDPSPIADTSTHHRWHCIGEYGGNTATNCQKAIPPDPVNGACDNSIRNGCSAGTAKDSAIADTSTYYRWHCEGLNGGTTVRNCQIRKPINGVCDNSKRNGCTSGDSDDSAIADTSAYYRWHCKGKHGGNTATNCQMAKPVNGVCDNSKRNGCTSGDFDDSAIADTSAYYRWHCVGKNGGNTATNCQIRKPVNGVCDNSKRNGCSPGTPDANAIADTSTHYRWHCKGQYGGSTATNCQKAIPVNGVCDNSKRNGCSVGTSNDAAAEDTSVYYKWYCLGRNGGSTATNCQKAKPVNGVCDNSQRNGCSAGTANDAAISDTNTYYRWHCVGLHGGDTATDCEKLISIDGACNNGRVNGCRNRTTLQDIEDTDTQHKWQCVGLNGGRTVTCSRSKAMCSINKYLCSEGSPENLGEGSPIPPVPESGEATHYTWTCISSDRKAVASCRTLQQTAHCGGTITDLIQINICLTGVPTDTEDSEDYHRWKCIWYESVSFCAAAKHGECGTSYLGHCSRGERISLKEEAGTWWCAGSISNASCSREE